MTAETPKSHKNDKRNKNEQHPPHQLENVRGSHMCDIEALGFSEIE